MGRSGPILAKVALTGALLLQVPVCCLAQEQENAQVPTPQRVIHLPKFVLASQADFLKDNDRVIGVYKDGTAKAYWAPMVVWHHLIEDRIGDVPILVTWCSLCGTCLVFRSEVNGQVLTFDVNGVRGLNMALLDKETHSRWQQATGEAFAGPLAGKSLPLVPFRFTNWGTWRTLYPHTMVILPEPQERDNYLRMEVFMQPPPFEIPLIGRLLHQDPRMLAHQPIAGISAGSGYKAYALDDLKGNPVVNDQVGSEPVLVIYTASDDTVTAYSRRIGKQILTFRPSTGYGLTDKQTGSVWNPWGICLRGKLKGKHLKAITPEPAFWFAWAEFHPNTQVYFPQ
jgi:Protein of unknown function (DUF3179)